ncbi:hypothetical protein Aeqsu_1592 [Aequorivita sublithincola DSM 14238]|uniref:Uncharacterized protein n=1 Tax=Aequorivita sublithincola (strain DSM 14238 / LMG 21431 / ACAM 643 / 9-3) TaxID=746697 RepID=I3YVQ9_AEQSU|nr:hypothetical protein [Aequorivita sublithincola]AFL81077.1 hypothetical protein Aeqsu_1592 [Aequorivita sublithincola DSM 14238]
MKNLSRISTILIFSLIMTISLASYANVIPYSNYNIENKVGESSDISIEFMNNNFETTKLPWWLVIISVEFGMNVPNCSCCYNGICRIGKTSGNVTFDTEAQLAKYLNDTGNTLLAVNDKNEVYIFIGSNDKSKEFKDGFSLDYLPIIDDSVINELKAKGITFNNLKKQQKYTPTIAAAGYKMLRIK